MSALPPKADIPERQLDVRFVPKADSCSATIQLLGRSGSQRNAQGENGADRSRRSSQFTS
jgi:hypothetical protein